MVRTKTENGQLVNANQIQQPGLKEEERLTPEPTLNREISNPEEGIDRRSRKFNLHYLVAPEEPGYFPWKLAIIGIVCLLALIAGIALKLKRQTEGVVVLHTVGQQDTLRGLALYYYNNPNQWHKIYMANREKLLHQQKLIAGQKLRISLTQSEWKQILMKQKKQTPKGQ